MIPSQKQQQLIQQYGGLDIYNPLQQQMTLDGTTDNTYYYQLSNHKRKNHSTDRRHLQPQKIGRNITYLTKRDTPLSINSRKPS